MLLSMTPLTPADPMARLGRLVRSERQRQGLRQDDLAALAHVSRNTVTAIESGLSPNPKKLPLLMEALGMDPGDVLADVPAPGAAPPLAHLTDAQLGHEAIRFISELTARLMARPVATAVPPPHAHGVQSSNKGRTAHHGTAT